MGFITHFFRDIIQADPGAVTFQQGEQAWASGVGRAANPHAGGMARAQWFKGWEHASKGLHYQQGWDARLAGLALEDNPYVQAQAAADAWAQGWHDRDDWAASQF